MIDTKLAPYGALLLRGEDAIQRVLAGDVSLRPLMDGPR